MALPNTCFGASKIAELLSGKRKLWFIGIGGSHMAQLARFAADRGFSVGGSDRCKSKATDRLLASGIPVCFSHEAANVVEADAVVYTLAISADNPEYRAAVGLGIPVFSRADFLYYLMAQYPCRIGVSGSHGKSTVTAMLAEIFTRAGRAPTVFCGAPLKGEGSFRGGEVCIFEACEYQNSFLCFSPTLALILNVQLDHVDFFESEQSLHSSFSSFAAGSGQVLAFAEDAAALACARACSAPPATFGVLRGDYHAEELSFCDACARFIAVTPNTRLPVALRVPGKHNVANALAAIGAAELCGIEHAHIAAALGEFRGVSRRMEYRGLLCGARVFDDYAHHPTEVAAVLQTAREMAGRGRVFAVFQSHTYSRTAAFFDELCTALLAADRVFLSDIYPARERDTKGMSAARLAEGIGDRADAKGLLSAIAAALEAEVAPGDVVMVMGAGDVDRIFGEFSAKHFTL